MREGVNVISKLGLAQEILEELIGTKLSAPEAESAKSGHVFSNTANWRLDCKQLQV